MIVCAAERFARKGEDTFCHHERWNGSGNPQGLKGKEIPLLARITVIACQFIVKEVGSITGALIVYSCMKPLLDCFIAEVIEALDFMMDY